MTPLATAPRFSLGKGAPTPNALSVSLKLPPRESDHVCSSPRGEGGIPPEQRSLSRPRSHGPRTCLCLHFRQRRSRRTRDRPPCTELSSETGRAGPGPAGHHSPGQATGRPGLCPFTGKWRRRQCHGEDRERSEAARGRSLMQQLWLKARPSPAVRTLTGGLRRGWRTLHAGQCVPTTGAWPSAPWLNPPELTCCTSTRSHRRGGAAAETEPHTRTPQGRAWSRLHGPLSSAQAHTPQYFLILSSCCSPTRHT